MADGAPAASPVKPFITILGLNAIAAAAALLVVPKREQMAL